VQRIRGDAVLNVISRSGDASFQTDLTTVSGDVGPGPASLLDSAAAAQSTFTVAAAEVDAAEGAATAWHAANAEVYRLGAAAGYDTLELDITQAINDDQSAFRTAVAAGSDALNPVEPVVSVAALLMALTCWWGLHRRLAEYR
jgi:hypothetical protein